MTLSEVPKRTLACDQCRERKVKCTPQHISRMDRSLMKMAYKTEQAVEQFRARDAR